MTLCSGLLLIAAGTLSLGAGRPASIPWRTDTQKALAHARKVRQAVLIDFYADWCGPCRLMEETTFTDVEVVSVLRQMTCVRVNIDLQPGMARRYQVATIPRVMVMDAEGKTLIDTLGYLDADTLLGMLENEAQRLGGLKFKTSSGTAGAKGMNPTTLLIEDLGAPQRRVRERAAQQLRTVGAKAVLPLVDALSHPHLAVRIGAYGALRDLVSLPPGVRYDPWATKAVRQKSTSALRGWWKQGQGGKGMRGKG